MSLLATLVLAAAAARVESVSLTTLGSLLAVRVLVSGTPGRVTLLREGDVARVSIMDADLGLRFAAGRRFSWTPPDGSDPALSAVTPDRLGRVEIVAGASEVSLLLRLPPEVSMDVRRDLRGLLLVFRGAGVPAEPGHVPRTAPETAPGALAPKAAGARPAETADLAKRLFPAAPGETPAATTRTVAELYPLLFPAGAPPAQPEGAAPPEVVDTGQEAGRPLGPFRVRAAVDARYVEADTFVESTAVPTEDRYLEVQPRVAAATPVGEGLFTLDYAPVFRAFATYDAVNSSSHAIGAGLELPVGPRVSLRARNRFRSGVLDTRVVDPGGEYFFGLGPFRRNDAEAGATVMVGPRLSVELGGTIGALRFQEPSSFFDYDSRSASAGVGFEVTPNLKAVASYVYDTVPRPDERPEAESTSHSGQLTLSGDILPLLSGDFSIGYRDQHSPNAGPGGTSYSGLTMSAALTRQLGPESSLALHASRSTPVSAYERNAFYVSTGLQGTLQVPLPAQLQLRGGVGYQWNDYRTVATEIGIPREDRILGWNVGLRRPIRPNLFLSGAYRNEDRRSNVNAFDTDAHGLYLQLEWDMFGTPAR
jgi:hypothetical protein